MINHGSEEKGRRASEDNERGAVLRGGRRAGGGEGPLLRTLCLLHVKRKRRREKGVDGNGSGD